MQNNINLFQTPTSNIPPSAVAHSILQNTRACSQANGATVPIQSAIQVLVQNPRFQSSTEAHFTATAKGEEPSSAAWALARVGALFDAVYQDCVFTDKDPEIIQSLSREIDLLEQDLKVRGDVPKEEQEFDLECLRQAKNALAELNSMPVVVEKLQPIQDVLNRSNYTLASSNPGEEISAVPHIKTAVDALTALQKLAASLPDDSAAGTLLNDLARKEAKKLEGTLVQWHERSIQARKRLMEEISTAPAETKDDLTSQMESLRRQQKSLHKELKEIADNMPPELATLSHGIQKIVKAVAREYTTVKKNLAGGTSPGLIKRVVHGILVMMQLSQKAIGETQKIGEIIGPTQHQANSVSAEVQQSHDEMMLQDPSNALAQAGPNAHAYSVVTPDTPQLLPWPRRMLAAIDSVFTFPSAAAQEIKIVSFVQERRDDGQQKIDNAVSTLNEIVQQAPLAARELSREIALLQRELIKTSKTAPKDTCSLVELAHWAQEVNDRCYAVERLEHHIAALMSQARDALTVDDVELEKYGKKHANLVKQARLVEGLKLEGINVPLPHGIASDRVEKFLRKHAPEVFTEWEALGNEHAAYRGRGKFLEESTSKTHLINIVKRIRESFQAASKDENLFNELTSTEFSAWLESVRDSHDYLMVRSTGSEDSRQTANAGGNISKAYVSPVRQEFCVAAGEVVASYFEYASLQNRINAGINPFEQELKLAVTAQQLIGEPVGGKTDTLAGIPISLVLFTSEPLYVGNERFRTMRISATYGHGEGVVGEQGIASDTALMLISEAHPDRLYVLYDNKEKPQRLAPVETPEGIKLQPVSNPSSLRKQPALNAELLSRLYTWGVVGEKFFEDNATDMEIVIKGNTIYPVQARPVNRPDLLPTYLDTKKVAALAETPIMQKLEATILVPGKASVVVATSPDQVHFAITLEEAQNSYDKEKHQAVIVTRPEPANSHPVVNFSALGTPCLVMENGDKAQELLKKASPKHPVVIDMQTGVVQLWDTAKGDVNNYISKGFAVHPAKIAISLPVTEAPKPSTAPSEVPQEVKDLVVAIRSATTHAVAKQRLAELRQHGWVTSIKKHKAELANHKVVPKAAQIHSVLDELDQKIEAAFDEVEAVLQQAPETARLRPLIQIKVLETLLIGKPTHDTSLGQYSLIDAEPLYRDAKILVDYQKKFSHPVHFADIYLAGAKAFEESTQKDWQSFLEDLEQRVQSGEVTLSQIKQLHALVSTLERTGTLTTWFTFFFKKVPIDEVLATLPTNDAKTIDTLMKLGNTIQTSKDKLDDFADPKTFPAAWKRLQAFAESLTGVGPTSVSELFKTESPLPRLMIINIMNESVDLFDRAIKQMKASSAWTPEEKVPIFKEMLSAYFTLLERWSTQLEPELSTLTNSNWTLESYLEKMKMLFEKFGNHPEQLQTTAGFSVTAAALGSKADFQFHHPQSLEDFFTLVHQNHLSVISNLNGKVFSPQVLGQSLLPEHFKQALAQADAAKMEGVRGEQQRIGISITENAASVKYNIPLRQHSAQMNLKYDKSNKKMTLEASIYGGNEFERWGITHFLSLFLEKLGIFRLTKPIHQTEQEITLALNIEDMQHLKWALEEFDNLCQQSYSLQYKDHDQELIKMVTRYGFSNQDVVRVFGSLNYEDPFIRLGLRTGFKFETLIDKGLFTFEKLTDLAQKGMSDHDRDVRANALKSFIVLVRSQKSLEEATRAAGVGINDNDSTVRRTSLDLFDYLVDRDCAYEEALLAAEKGLTDDDSGVRTKSISLFQTLYSRDKYSMHIPIRKVIRAAKIGAYDNNQYVHTAALRLLQTLVHSGYAFEEAELAATESLSNPFSFAFSQSISKEILEEIDQRTSFLGWLVWTLSILSIASLEVKK